MVGTSILGSRQRTITGTAVGATEGVCQRKSRLVVLAIDTVNGSLLARAIGGRL